MQGASHGDEVDDAGGTLQRVERAQRTVETFLVAGPLLECEQIVVALGHQLTALDHELLDELVHAGKPHMIATCSTSRSCPTGFTR